ncbi:phage baseplate assembly protein V [Ilyobacter sp.]|uniref:phage baseplate assembly protein V n=1 Tax=Ilyobacter sp. TaxID=3100343 RepID=UPI003561B1E1
MIHVGYISSVNYESGTVRVKIPDMDDFITGSLIVFQGRTNDTKDYEMPDIEEMGLVILLPNGNSHGFYIGSGYSKTVPVPEGAGKGKRMVVFDDGTKVEYDKTAHKLTIECVGNIEVSSNSTTIRSNNIIFDGPVTHNNGDYNNPGGDVTAGDISLKNHKTTKVTAGLGVSGPPSA